MIDVFSLLKSKSKSIFGSTQFILKSLILLLLIAQGRFLVSGFRKYDNIAPYSRSISTSLLKLFNYAKDFASLTIQDSQTMSTKELFSHVVEDSLNTDETLLFKDVKLYKGKPTINKFIIANPKIFLKKFQMSKLYTSTDLDSIDETTPLKQYFSMLPVIYIAENHPEYGTLGSASILYLSIKNMIGYFLIRFYVKST